MRRPRSRRRSNSQESIVAPSCSNLLSPVFTASLIFASLSPGMTLSLPTILFRPTYPREAHRVPPSSFPPIHHTHRFRSILKDSQASPGNDCSHCCQPCQVIENVPISTLKTRLKLSQHCHGAPRHNMQDITPPLLRMAGRGHMAFEGNDMANLPGIFMTTSGAQNILS